LEKQFQPAFEPTLGLRHNFSIKNRKKMVEFSSEFQLIQGFFKGNAHPTLSQVIKDSRVDRHPVNNF